jgi:transposase
MCASRTKGTYLATRYRRIAARRGKKRALVAVGHCVLTAVWIMLTRDVPYHDLGPDHFIQALNERGKTRQTRRLIEQFNQLGYQVALHPTRTA